MTRVAITGATGRMGQELLAAAQDRPIDVAIATSRTPEDGPIAGVDLEPAAELPALLSRTDVDVVVDFTAPEASESAVTAAAETGVAAVVGTTGFDETQLSTLRSASDEIPVLVAANFSKGVQVLRSIVGEVAGALPEYDVELIETHHNGKRDAPSGTAGQLLDEIEQARTESERVHGREGEHVRSTDEIGVHSLRAGNVTGEHEVVLAGDHEQLRLIHRAGNRQVFAEGALDAAEWLTGREPGWYDFAAVLGGPDQSTPTP